MFQEVKNQSTCRLLADTENYRACHIRQALGFCCTSQIFAASGDIAGGDAGAAQAAFAAAIRAYEKALQAPTKLGKLQDRCDARYNAACALALGRRQAEANQLLQQLLMTGVITANDVAQDSDLFGLQ